MLLEIVKGACASPGEKRGRERSDMDGDLDGVRVRKQPSVAFTRLLGSPSPPLVSCAGAKRAGEQSRANLKARQRGKQEKLKQGRELATCKTNLGSVCVQLGGKGCSLADVADFSGDAALDVDGGTNKRPARVNRVCCYCATPRVVSGKRANKPDFSCADSSKTCMVKCVWCKKSICGDSLLGSLEKLQIGIGAHAQVCTKTPTVHAVAQRLINLSARLPFSAVVDPDEEVWVQFAQDCLDCTTPSEMGTLIGRIYRQIKPSTLHASWRENESLEFEHAFLRVKSLPVAAVLVLRLEYGAVDWGRVDICFRMERAAEGLVMMCQATTQHVAADEGKFGIGQGEKEGMTHKDAPTPSTIATTPTEATVLTVNSSMPVGMQGDDWARFARRDFATSPNEGKQDVGQDWATLPAGIACYQLNHTPERQSSQCKLCGESGHNKRTCGRQSTYKQARKSGSCQKAVSPARGPARSIHMQESATQRASQSPVKQFFRLFGL